MRCGACCFLRGICVLRGCSIICTASRSPLLRRGRSDLKHVTVVRGNLARRSGIDLPRETVRSSPVPRTTVTHLHVSGEQHYLIATSPACDIVVGIPTIDVILFGSFVPPIHARATLPREHYRGLSYTKKASDSTLLEPRLNRRSRTDRT